MTKRTIMQMEIDPRLIEAKRLYRERCRQIYQYLQNSLPQVQGIQSGYTSSTSFIEGLIGDIAGRGAGW